LLPITGIAKSLAVQPPMKSIVELPSVLMLAERKLWTEPGQKRLRKRSSLGQPIGLSSLAQRVSDHAHQAAERDREDSDGRDDLDEREACLATAWSGSPGRDASARYVRTKAPTECSCQRTSRCSDHLSNHFPHPTSYPYRSLNNPAAGVLLR
jgi:hypothetical protein